MSTSSKTPSTYRDAMLEVLDCLTEISSKIDTQPLKADPAIEEQLRHLTERQDETIELLRQMNGNVRQHSVLLAEHGQWIKDHETQVHPVLDERVKSVATKANTLGWLDTALSLIAGVLAGLRYKSSP